MLAEIAPGTLVRHRDGGPVMAVDMVVRNLEEADAAWTRWRDGSQQKEGKFPLAELEPLRPVVRRKARPRRAI